MKNSNFVDTKVELDRFEGEKAVLYSDDNVEVIVPKKFIPGKVAEGDTLILRIATDKAETEKQTQKAKELLNEILNF